MKNLKKSLAIVAVAVSSFAVWAGPASATETCLPGAKQDRQGDWHNPTNGHYCSTTTTTGGHATTTTTRKTKTPTKTAGAVVVTPKYTG